MKKTIKTLLSLFVASSLVMVSCKKDDTTATTTVTGGPTVTLTDSFGTNNLDILSKNSIIKLSVVKQTGTILLSQKVTRTINSGAAVTLDSGALTANQSDGFSFNIPVSESLTGVTLAEGDKITFTCSITDSKSQTSTGSITYTVVKHVAAVTVSNAIELGAQSDVNHLYKFLGSNYQTYTAGANGTAKANSADIDFVYYYGQNDNNAFAAPSNTNGAQVIWSSEIATWATKNATMFKTTTITKAQFATSSTNLTTAHTLIGTIDFTSGTSDKITGIVKDQVIAFKAANGTTGLISFSQVSADATGSTIVTLISEK